MRFNHGLIYFMLTLAYPVFAQSDKVATLNVQPIDAIGGWHKTSPDLTASGRLWQGRWGQAALVKLLSTGLGPGGNPADPAMPTYKMTQDDAEAVVEYLKSLK
jgi:hypothetical protein